MTKAAAKSTKTDPKEILDRKAKAKADLQKQLEWPIEPKRAMICLPAGLTQELGGELFKQLIDGLLSLPVELVILGKGSSTYGEMAMKLANEHKHRIAIVPNDKKSVETMLNAADIALFMADPSDLEELGACLAHGVVPVSIKSKMLEQYNPVQERGTAFIYDKPTVWHAFAAVVRALETHVFPFDWKTIQKQCIRSVLGE